MKNNLPNNFVEGVTNSVQFNITQKLVDKFVELTGDSSSLHTDKDFGDKSMYDNKVVHGMLPLIFIAELEKLYPKEYSCIFKEISARFLKPIFLNDKLSLVSEISEINEKENQIRVEYILKKIGSESVLTTGYFKIKYKKTNGSKELLEKNIKKDSKKGLVLDSLKEETITFENIEKGDKKSFNFKVSEKDLLSTYNILLKNTNYDTWSGKNVSKNLIVSCLFSTFVGMCIPGRHATFTDFKINFENDVELNKKYKFLGKVSFKSSSTSIIVENISISQNNGERVIASGKINVKVNDPQIEMLSLESLKKEGLDLELKDKVVLITGASSGIGQTTAKLFSLYGTKVIINYFKGKDSAERIVKEIIKNKGDAIAIKADIRDIKQVKKMVNTACKKYGDIHILVNNAVKGFYPKSFTDLNWEDVQGEMDVTLKGTFNCCQEIIPLMLKNKSGKIINMLTVATESPPANQAKYVIAKSALIGLTRSLAVDLAPSNIQVNMVSPSIVKTNLTKHVSNIFLDRLKNETPMKRNATPVDVAKAIIFLSSSLAPYTTGQKIMVTGGNPPFL
ncbi:hypothetical protein CEE44_02165 [Candidatus Woesearchaeota archaeon B3_Woes]|nr:MAG: hypothetical protein CEE44_02165 [Candidatus Woesearchaeota archaeon B3_Woes]